MSMQRVIIESPFAGGEGILMAHHMISDFAYQATARKGTKGARGFRARTLEEAIRLACREIAVKYARAAMNDCLQRGEAPYASHLLYTQEGVLNDDKPDERQLGIEAGLCWGAAADKTVVYIDLGISDGMQQGIERAKREGRPIEQRQLKGWS